MSKQAAYRANADECRSLAAKMIAPPERKQILLIAEQWERMAVEAGALANRACQTST